ncbi:cyclic GMP-AMP synthase [Rhinolophus ferrumequinum]|uniref:Cyclic GMP-AMP synthase n=1 Tax=Rhinolophus ferrumequinum TaxID=59479 RepID=A0A7J7YQV2_RHIFE|nr:cyclic GMP-AMP synthase [Rhinolophus ferrumequinum]
MDSRRGKGTRKASNAGAAAPKVSAPRAKGALTKPTESRVVPEAARPNAQRCGSTRASGSQRKKSAPGPVERPQVGARRAGSDKAPQSAEDAVDGQAGLAEGPEPPAAPGAPLSRAGSRRDGGARAAEKQRPPPAPTAVPDLLGAPSLRQGTGVYGSRKLQHVLDKLRLRREEISEAADVVNKVVNHLLRRLQSFESEFKGVTRLCTGSYYEHVKISAPNEFDVMFKLEVPRIKLEPYCNSDAFYLVEFKRNPAGNPLSQFVKDGILSASLMLNKFRKIIKDEIKNIEDADVILERKKTRSPAVTLLIREPKEISVDVVLTLEANQSWPPSTQEGLPIKQWLGGKVKKALKLQPYCLVPKPAEEGSGLQEETWRLSFSHIEKHILENHGNSKTCCESDGVKCCRKDCLKLMKHLLEQLKNKFGNRKHLDDFCSYHVKTAFFHRLY